MSDHGKAQPVFMDLYLRGEVRADDIDDFIDSWHENSGAQELFEYLGMTKEEYALWLRDPEMLPAIARARQGEFKPVGRMRK